MKATHPFPLLCPALAVLTGLVLGAGVCFAQPPPPVRLGDPFQPGSPPAAPVPAPQNTVPPPAVQIGPPQPNAAPAAPGPPGVEPQLRVGEIKVLGNRWTKERVIRRQIPLEPGQVLSLPDLRLAEYNLARLGIFEVDPLHGIRPTVTVDPEGDSEFKNIIVQVQETQTTSLLFGVSVNSDAGLNGSVVFNERNFDLFGWPSSLEDFAAGRAFRGGGQELRIEATPGTEEQRYAITFREPFLFDSCYALQAGGYYYDFAFHDEYTESRLGTRITLSRRFGPNWNVDGTLRVEDVDIHHIAFGAPPEITQDAGAHALVGFRAGVNYDTRDSIYRPTQGVLASLSVEEVTGDYTFPKLILGGNKYWTLSERSDGSGRQVLLLRSELGYAGSHTPVFERFFDGGFRTLRGFAFRGVGPNDRGFEVGGDFEFLNSLEYQAPLLANDHLYGVAFLDTGTVERSVEIRNYRVAAGLGLRLYIPQLGPLPIALDFATPISKAHGDHTQLLSFWIGFIH